MIDATALIPLFTPEFLSQLPFAPSTLLLQQTTLNLVGAFAPHLAHFEESVTSTPIPAKMVLLATITFIVKCLTESVALGSHAAKSLRDLCRVARKQLVEHVTSFVGVLSGLEGNIEVRYGILGRISQDS